MQRRKYGMNGVSPNHSPHPYTTLMDARTGSDYEPSMIILIKICLLYYDFKFLIIV